MNKILAPKKLLKPNKKDNANNKKRVNFDKMLRNTNKFVYLFTRPQSLFATCVTRMVRLYAQDAAPKRGKILSSLEKKESQLVAKKQQRKAKQEQQKEQEQFSWVRDFAESMAIEFLLEIMIFLVRWCIAIVKMFV